LRAHGATSVPLYQPDAVTVPGAIDGFCTLSENWGKLGLETILAPAIHYAEHGVAVAPRVAFDWKHESKTLQGHGRAHYLNNGGFLKLGDVFRAPGQAEVLKRVAKQGRDAFYSGEIAEDMVNTLRALGGLQTLQDFDATRSSETTPVHGPYKHVDLVEHPPNGQGATAILMLNILSHFDIAGLDPVGAARAHIEAEAAKLAYDARNRIIADADHTTHLDHMLAPDTASKLAMLIDPNKAMEAPAQRSGAVHKDTVYITVVDKDRMAVSLIYSIFEAWGSGIASEKFGILMHNRGAGFTLEEGHPNELAGGKRPMHTIIPAVLRQNGRVTVPFGVMGGSFQPTGHARFVSNMVDYGLDVQSAIDLPRCFSDAGILKVERGYSDQVRQELADMGHRIDVPVKPLGGAQAIVIHDNGVLEGGSDPRKDGCAIGY